MKHLKSFDESFNLNTFMTRLVFGKNFVKDQDIAEGILKSLQKNRPERVEKPNEESNTLVVDIDGFKISIGKGYSLKSGNYYYDLRVDDSYMSCTSAVTKKIWNICEEIYKSNDQKEIDNEYTKKDARLHFTKNR